MGKVKAAIKWLGRETLLWLALIVGSSPIWITAMVIERYVSHAAMGVFFVAIFAAIAIVFAIAFAMKRRNR